MQKTTIPPVQNPTSNIKFCRSVAWFLLLFVAIGIHSLSAQEEMPLFKANSTILFQGDSITDGNRGRGTDPNHILGHGYMFIIAAKYGAKFPERGLNFVNRGVSGNRASDLAARWQNDTLNLKPDVLSILVGINDNASNVPIDQYEATLDKLLADTRAACPGVKFVLCEPFTLPVGRYKNNFDAWNDNVKKRARVVEKLARKYQAPVVYFQKAIDEACLRAPADHWIWDGIHPTYSGHQILADEWIKTVSEFYR